MKQVWLLSIQGKRKTYPLIVTIHTVIHEQSMEIKDFNVVDGFFGCLEAQGWLSAFTNIRPKVVMTLIAKFYHSMNR